jgi:D-amino-acid dehydrogenase
MRIVVLGAGIVGVTTAYELATDGHEVVVVDRQDKAAMETSFSNAGMVSPGHAYTWASPRAPKILWQSIFRDDVALRLRLRLDPAMWRWCWRFLQECTSERAAINTAHKVRLCLYSQERFAEINGRIPIDYDRRTQGAIYVYRDQDHLDRGVGSMRILTDNGVTLRPVSTGEAVDIEPALAPDSPNIAGATVPRMSPATVTSSRTPLRCIARLTWASRFGGRPRSGSSLPKATASRRSRRTKAPSLQTPSSWRSAPTALP